MRLLLSLFLVLAFILPARAETALSPEAQAAEDYLGGIRTLKARFIQTDNDGRQLTGDFFLKRPGRMRFQYDAPVTDFIVADGLFVYYYDGEMKQQSNAPIGQSLADFFLRRDLKLSGALSVSGVKRDGGYLQITLTQAKDPLAGSLTLAFTEKPMQLKKWRVVDAQGSITEVDLFNVETGIKLDGELFKYYDPAAKKGRYN